MPVIKTEKSGIATKLLYKFHDGYAAEVSLIERPDKNIICFSTMIGCPIGCTFCYSGVVDKYIRRLTGSEMLRLIHEAEQLMEDPYKLTVYSAMGEGEPALNTYNLDLTFQAIKIWCSDYKPYKLALSTVAPNSKSFLDVIDLALKHNIKVQYSFHVADQYDRQIFMRSAKMQTRDVLDILNRNNINTELNFTLIKGMNDNPIIWERIQEILKATNRRWKLKLNRYNTIPIVGSECARPEKYIGFKTYFVNLGHEVEYYETDGVEINAACGQLHYRNVGG